MTIEEIIKNIQSVFSPEQVSLLLAIEEFTTLEDYEGYTGNIRTPRQAELVRRLNAIYRPEMEQSQISDATGTDVLVHGV